MKDASIIFIWEYYYIHVTQIEVDAGNDVCIGILVSCCSEITYYYIDVYSFQ